MDQRINLANVEEFTIPFDKHRMKWIFDRFGISEMSEEHKDQIHALDDNAAFFLWKFQGLQKMFSFGTINSEHYKDINKHAYSYKTENETSKWLYNRGIKLDNKVYWVPNSKNAFVLTWKMIIKYATEIFFGHDEIVWDKSYNWLLIHDHNDVFYFGNNRIFNSNIESDEILKNTKIINEAINRMNNQSSAVKYSKNKYKR